MLMLLPGVLFAASEEEQIIQRIAPAGTVCLIGDSCAGGATVASAGAGAQSPEQVYNTFCTACHTTGANNAPVRGDAAAWQPRTEKGLDTLYQNAISGFNNNAMPAKGLCMSCSDDDIKATVDFILSALQ